MIRENNKNVFSLENDLIIDFSPEDSSNQSGSDEITLIPEIRNNKLNTFDAIINNENEKPTKKINLNLSEIDNYDIVSQNLEYLIEEKNIQENKLFPKEEENIIKTEENKENKLAEKIVIIVSIVLVIVFFIGKK